MKQCPVNGDPCDSKCCNPYCGLQASAKCRFCGMYSRNTRPFVCADCWRQVIEINLEFPELTSMTDIVAEHQRQVQDLTQRIGERDALIARIELNTRPGLRTLSQAEFILLVINDACNREQKSKPIIDRCTTCGMALNDDGTCDDCFLSHQQQGLIDAMERGDELRDRAKDEKMR